MSRPALLVLAVLLVGARPASERPAQRAVPNDNRAPAGVRDGDTLSLRLVATRAAWRLHEDEDATLDVLAFAEEGEAPTIPGPLLRMTEGTPVRVAVRNAASDTLVVHGLGVRGDGARDSLVVAPGATTVARFAAGTPGSYLYWGAVVGRAANIALRRGGASQLTGAFVIDPAGQAPAPDRVFVITATVDTLQPDGSFVRDRHGLPLREFVAVNGRSWPHTERLAYTVGDSVRWRVLNGSLAPHSLHLHGFYFRVDAKGLDLFDADTAYAPAERRMAVTELVLQGHTMSMVWSPARAGGWLFHCHMTMHAVREPPIGRRDVVDYPAHHAHANPDEHAVRGMGGLVLGTTVRPRVATTVAARDRWRPAHTLRLFVQSDSAPNDSARRFGYVLQRGAEPARDSVAPAPVLVLTRGEPTQIDVVNRSGEPTSVHWHGIELESYYDGVIGFGRAADGRPTPAVRDGATFGARMTPPRAGTFMYHTHFDELRQQFGGLAGALLVLEPGERWDPERDRVFVITDGVFRRVSVNGSLAPPPQTMRVGVTYRLRFANAAVDRPALRARITADTGYTPKLGEQQPTAGRPLAWRPIAKDGWPVSSARRASGAPADRVGNGETLDAELTPEAPGDARLELVTFDPTGTRMVVLAVVPLRFIP